MKISLCMIVKNEARWIAQALESVAGLCDEIIVVDTGSSDGTPELARSRGAKIFPLEWPNDFSAARNYSIERATGDWILVLDADEMIAKKDHDAIRALTRDPSALMYSLIQTNYGSESTVFGWKKNDLAAPEAQGFPGYVESPLARLFRNIPEIRFEGRVHEHAVHSKGVMPVSTHIRVHHYGKYSDPQRTLEKHRLYLNLGEEKVRDNPHDAHAWYELGVQYSLLNDFENALRTLRQSEKIDPNYVKPQLAMAAVALTQCNSAEAIRRFSRVMSLDSKHIDPYMHLPRLLADQGQYPLAEEIMMLGNKVAGTHPVYRINSGVTLLRMGNYRGAVLQFKEAIRLNPKEGLGWLNLGIAHISLEEWGLAHKALGEALAFEGTRLMAFKKKAEAYFRARDLKNAERWILDACDEFPEDGEAFYQQAIIKIQGGDREGAKVALSKIRHTVDFGPEEIKNLIQCHLAVGNTREAGELKARMQLH